MAKSTKNIIKLKNSNKSVFTTAELALYWKIADKNILRVTISRYLKKGYLIKIRRGLYTLEDDKINIYELANKMKKFSYVSFETVLAKEGIIFQWHDEIFSACSRASSEKNKFGKFKYRQMPLRILFNKEGIVNKGNYFIAAKERALCDKIYKDGLRHFDDLGGINKKFIIKISKIYNKRLERDIARLIS